MPLKINLRANEKIVINGGVISVGDRRASIIVHNRVLLLREKDVLTEDKVNTPVKHVYWAVQMLYLENDPEMRRQYRNRFDQRAAELRSVLINPEMRAALDEVIAAVEAGDFYRGLAHLRTLLGYEESLLSHRPAEDRPTEQTP